MGLGRKLAVFATAAVAGSASVTIASAQENDRPGIIDVLRERIARELQRTERARSIEQEKIGEPQLIDFETTGAAVATTGAVVQLTTQYRESHGVSFGKGDSIELCSENYNEFRARLCPYARAASGQRAAMHDVEAGGAAMQVFFDSPVAFVSLRINPTGGRIDEEFIARIIGFDANGNRAGVSTVRFNWHQDAFTWPTGVSLEAEAGQGFSRIDIDLRRASGNNAVRFLIDDLAFTPARIVEAAPVAAAIAALDSPPKVGRAIVVQSPQIGPAQSALQVYPAAVRKRLQIDWDAVDAALADQSLLGLTPSAISGAGQKYVDIAALPILLPQDAEADTLQIFGNGDVVNAVWRVGGRDYSVYGSRLVTVIEKAQGASGVQSAITYSGSEDELTASFSLYGASYALTQYCVGGAKADPDCYDRDALGKVAEGLVVAVGEAGRARP